jgi:TRAP-type C4-dicarboxylate transport system substrate-binding protein
MKASKDFWDDLSNEDKKSIDRGLADVKANRVKPYNKTMEKIKNRLPK